MKLNKNLLSILAIALFVCLFTFGFKSVQTVNESKETLIIYNIGREIFIVFPDGKEEHIQIVKDKSVVREDLKLINATLNRFIKEGYSIQGFTSSFNTTGHTVGREYILTK